MPVAYSVPPEALNAVTVTAPLEIVPSTVVPDSRSVNEQVPVTVAASPGGVPSGAAAPGAAVRRRAPVNGLGCSRI